MSNRDEKRAKFATPDKGKKGGMKYLVIGLTAVVLLVGGLMAYKGKGTDEKGYVDATQTEDGAQTARIDAASVTAEVSGGTVSIPVSSVKENKLVEFSFTKADGEEVPLLAYESPSGEVRAAVRMCEPCNSRSFHLEGDEIVCNACGSRWKLEDLSGVSGGCLTYPPESLKTTEKGGKLGLSVDGIASWKPRV